MARECPRCARSCEHLNYRCSITGWESGTVNNEGDWESDDDGIEDHSDYEYFCPHCERQISTQHPDHWLCADDEDEDDEDEDDVPTEKSDNSIWSNQIM